MAITVIAGTLVATFLTLVVIPVLYAVLTARNCKVSAPGARRHLPPCRTASARAQPGALTWSIQTPALRRPVTTLWPSRPSR
jgi:hypothetical protein